MRIQSMHNHSCLLLFHEEEEPLTEEVPAEVVRQANKDPLETDEMGRNVRFAKLQGAPPESSLATTIQSALGGQEEMLRILE